jgi:hypothetical protein
MTKLIVGMPLHYVSHGTVSPQYPSSHRAAFITALDGEDVHSGLPLVSIAFITPTSYGLLTELPLSQHSQERGTCHTLDVCQGGPEVRNYTDDAPE